MLLRLAWITLAGYVFAFGPLVSGSLPLQTGLVVVLCLAVAGTLLVIASVRPGRWSVHDREATRQGRASLYGAEVLLLMTLTIEGVGFFVIAFYYMWRLL